MFRFPKHEVSLIPSKHLSLLFPKVPSIGNSHGIGPANRGDTVEIPHTAASTVIAGLYFPLDAIIMAFF